MDRPYHHGDLKAALLDAAMEVVENQGHQALSLRDIAASLAVSRAAPYRHFPDREALLSAVAASGYRALLSGYEAALAGIADPAGRLRVLARVYLGFAADRPALFRLMSDILADGREPTADLRAPADAAYFLREDAIASACPQATPREVKARTLAMWSMLQGYVMLRRDGRVRPHLRAPLTEAEADGAILAAACEAALGRR